MYVAGYLNGINKHVRQETTANCCDNI